MLFDNKPNTILFIFYLFGQYPHFGESMRFKFKPCQIVASNLPSWIWFLFSFVSFNDLINRYNKNRTDKTTISAASTYVSIGFIICSNAITRYESISTVNVSRQFVTASISLREYMEQTFHYTLIRTGYFRRVYRKTIIIVAFVSIRLCTILVIPCGVCSNAVNLFTFIELVYKDFSTLYLIVLVDFNRYLIDSVMRNLDRSVSSVDVYAITYDSRKIVKMLRHLKSIHFKAFENTALLNNFIGWAALSTSLDAFWRTMNGFYSGLTLDITTNFCLISKSFIPI